MNEVDMTGVVNFVKKREKSFYDDEGFYLTYTPFIIYCTVKVLMEMPEFNSSFDGQSQIKHDNVNMGIAVSIDSGLMVHHKSTIDRYSYAHINIIVFNLRLTIKR